MAEAFELIQARGGLDPGSPPQTTCDVCRRDLDPAEAVELTVTRPARHGAGHTITRVYGHPACASGLPVLKPVAHELGL